MNQQTPIFLVLEPSNHMGRVIKAAKTKGYHVIAFHKGPISALPPYGDDFALIDQRILVPSWFDLPALLKQVDDAVGSRKIVGTYAGMEFTLELDARIRQKAGLPHNAPELIADLLNKKTVRERLKTAGLTVIKFYGREEVDQWTDWPEGFKAFFKPVYGGGSSLVEFCDNYAALDNARQMWRNKDDTKNPGPFQAYMKQGGDEYIVEEEIQGELLSVEGFSLDGKYHLLGITGRKRLADDLAIEMAGLFPHDVPFAAELVEKVRQIHQSLGIQYGPTHTEMIIDHKGGAELVEVNLRFPGADILLMMNACFDTKVENIILDFACGHKVDLSPVAKVSAYGALRYILPYVGMQTVGEFEFGDEVLFSRVKFPTGTEIPQKRTQGRHVAGIIVTGKDTADVEENMTRAIRQIKVDGKPFIFDINNILEP